MPEQPYIFSETAFESFYPDEEGQIEARKRLIFAARHAEVKNIPADTWKHEVLKNKEMCFYLELVGGKEMLYHIIQWVFVGF